MSDGRRLAVLLVLVVAIATGVLGGVWLFDALTG